MKLGDKIEQLLKQHKMTKTELASRMGLKDSSVISHWVYHRFHPGRGNLEKLCAVFEKPADYFADDTAEAVACVPEDAERRLAEALRDFETRSGMGKKSAHVGVVGTAGADFFGFSPDTIAEEYLPVLVEAYGDSRVYALRVRGSVLSPAAEDGDYAIISQTGYVDDGRLALVRLAQGCSLRRLFHKKNGIELKPENRSVRSVTLKEGEFSVIGQVIGFFRKP